MVLPALTANRRVCYKRCELGEEGAYWDSDPFREPEVGGMPARGSR